MTPGLVQCVRCAAVLVDAAEPRRVHDRFHDGLRLLWERAGTGSRAARPRRAAVGYRRRHPTPHEKEP
jgi:hypothetical protein